MKQLLVRVHFSNLLLAALLLTTLFLTTLVPIHSFAAEITVNPGESIQSAILSASDGDVITLSKGKYNEDINFLGKAITLRGVGRGSVIRGTGNGPVVTFSNGESASSVLDSVRIIGGTADSGGGIYIMNSSPTIVRNYVEKNRARIDGSGIHVDGNSEPLIMNNMVFGNKRLGGGDPHGIQVEGGNPMIINNTVVRNDSNGLLIASSATGVVLNNIFAFNGSEGNDRRGRGICNFGSGVILQYNLFYQNTISALIQGGRDFKKVTSAEANLGDPLLLGNVDGNPRLRPIKRGNAKGKKVKDLGHPDAEYNDPDGSRNDIGITGGPQAG